MQILLTGAFGNVGLSTLEELVSRGYYVHTFDIPSKQNLRIAKSFQDKIDCRWGDLRSFKDVKKSTDQIDIVLHVGAIIPPLADEKPKLAEAVNVSGTENIVQALEQFNPQARLVYTSSIAVYGDRRKNPMIRVTDPVNPGSRDSYAQQKVRAETMIKNSSLKWAIFRLTYITSMQKLQLDPLMFEMPLETSIEICDTKDVGLALANAVESETIWGKILHIAGGANCRTTFGEYLMEMFHLFGLGRNALPANAFSTKEFHCGYMDTEESQRLLHFQRQTLAEYYQQVRKTSLERRIGITLIRPLVRAWILNRSPYYNQAIAKKTPMITIKEYITQLKLRIPIPLSPMNSMK